MITTILAAALAGSAPQAAPEPPPGKVYKEVSLQTAKPICKAALDPLALDLEHRMHPNQSDEDLVRRRQNTVKSLMLGEGLNMERDFPRMWELCMMYVNGVADSAQYALNRQNGLPY